jgi:acyl dehydratase
LELDYDTVSVGDALPELVVTPTLMTAVMYSAAMWEFQKIHYDHEWARRENLDGAIVHGPVLGNYLARTVTQWTGPRARLTRLTWRHHGVAPLGRRITCTGSVTGKRLPAETECTTGDIGVGLIECELAIIDADRRKIVSGSACVAIPLIARSRP